MPIEDNLSDVFWVSCRKGRRQQVPRSSAEEWKYTPSTKEEVNKLKGMVLAEWLCVSVCSRPFYTPSTLLRRYWLPPISSQRPCPSAALMSKLAITIRYKSGVNHTAWLCQTSLTCSLGWRWDTPQVTASCKTTHYLMETVHQQTQKTHLLPHKHERAIKNLVYSMKVRISKGLYYLETRGGILNERRHLQHRCLYLK